MPQNLKQISVAACLLLVVLRISIGWQFLYEGLWKLSTRETARPWSAEGYLANARGPFRDFFRGKLDDPDGLHRLDYDTVVASWDDWRQRYSAQYPDLTDEQKQRLDVLLDGPKEFVEKLASLPEGVDLDKFRTPKGTFLRYDAKNKRLETDLHLLPKERDALLRLAKVDKDADAAAKDQVKRYQTAIKRLADRSSRLSLKEQLQVLLKEDPDRNGVVLEQYAGTIDHSRPGDVQIYRHLLERYEQNLAAVDVEFQQEHLAKQWQEIQEKRAALVGPVDALTREYHEAAYKQLTAEQMQRGPVVEAPTSLSGVNRNTMWVLTLLGLGLMLGLFSRVSAIGAACMLLMFYLAMPPWPGVPAAPGPEHSLIVNKNLIELIACLALAALPTGRWAGLDAIIHWLLFGRRAADNS